MIKNWWIRFLVFYGTQVNHPGKWRVHRKLLKWTNVHINKELKVNRCGLKLILNPANFVEEDVFWLASKDLWEVRHILENAKPGWTALDCGANFGYYSLKLAQHLNKDCTIYAFEPSPATYEKLNSHIKMNNMEECLFPVSMGLSEGKGKASLIPIANNTGGNHLSMTEGDIPLISIDEFCKERRLNSIHFIKLDVEGCELMALKGGRETINTHKPILLVEVCPRTLERLGTSAKELTDYIDSCGYNLFELSRERLLPLNDLPTLGEITNIVCIPESGLCP